MNKLGWIAAVVVALLALNWFISAPDSRSRELTQAIETQGSAELKAYPYQFRVLKVENGVAYMTTPRSFDVPAAKLIGRLFPEINTNDPNDPGFVAAEKHLAAIQGEAQKIVASQPGIKAVQWKIDRDWLTSHSIEVPDGAGP
ncbi:hypothetical protein [Rhodocyclus purpureus]|uniref:hypothetical protein n=1 Tax=Rhodocyclus purpureus TaxID=1067 RepID=UPI00191145F2|nr:hypothetical protein [Rhodocyclus purpureus]MBK5914019.1 hypothetical protein [Rhodocyclus purpureus]